LNTTKPTKSVEN